MATDPIAQSDTPPDEEAADALTPEEEASIARARGDAAAERVYSNVTTEALAAFGRLDDVEAQRLLDNPARLKAWLAAHA